MCIQLEVVHCYNANAPPPNKGLEGFVLAFTIGAEGGTAKGGEGGKTLHKLDGLRGSRASQGQRTEASQGLAWPSGMEQKCTHGGLRRSRRWGSSATTGWCPHPASEGLERYPSCTHWPVTVPPPQAPQRRREWVLFCSVFIYSKVQRMWSFK